MKVTSHLPPYIHSFGSEEFPLKYGNYHEPLPYSTSGLWFPPHMNSEFQAALSKTDLDSRTHLEFPGYPKSKLGLDAQNQLEEGKPSQLDVWVSSLDKRTNSPKSYEKGLKKCSPNEGRMLLDQIEVVSSDTRHCDEYKFPTTLYIFRAGISPIWQDQANIKGGRFTLVLSFPFKNDSFKKFNDLVQVLSLFHSTPKSVKSSQDTLNFLTEKNIVSKERALFRREVVGVSLKFQDSVNILSVWNKFAFNPNKLSSLTFVLSKLLGVSSARLRYRSHQESSGTQPTPENVVSSIPKPVIPPLAIPPQNNAPKVLVPTKKQQQPITPQKITKKRRQSQPGAEPDPTDLQDSEFASNQKFSQSASTPVSPHFSPNYSPFPLVNYLTPNGNPWSFWSEEQPHEPVDSPDNIFQKRKNSEEFPEVNDHENEQDDEILYLYEYYSTLAQQEKKQKLNKKSSSSDVNFLSLITSISCFPIVEDKAEPNEKEWSNDISSLQKVTSQQLRSRLEVLQLVENYYSISSKMSM